MVVNHVVNAPFEVSYVVNVLYILIKTSCVRSWASSADPAKR